MPKTCAAGGSVTWKEGQPMKGGSVLFSSKTDHEISVAGQIQDDGTFILHTIIDRSRRAGAPEGDYQVSVIPPLQGGHKGVPPIAVPGTFTIVSGGENKFKIQVDASPPAS
jgi:hypothetical protein